MDRFSSVLRRVVRALAALSLVVVLTGSSQIATAHSGESASHNGLTGTWSVDVTLRNCATGAPLDPTFRSLVTFHYGGTLSESTATLASAVGQRSPGHGTWSKGHGNTFHQRMVALILFDTVDTASNSPVSPGFFAGWQTITHTIEMTGPNSLTSSGTTAFFKSDGTEYRTGCSTAVGRRFR
jgi:hypothetical protein